MVAANRSGSGSEKRPASWRTVLAGLLALFLAFVYKGVVSPGLSGRQAALNAAIALAVFVAVIALVAAGWLKVRRLMDGNHDKA
jgi:hypothetical protein